MGIRFLSAVFFVQDINASRRFYEGILEQKVLMDYGPNVGFEGGFAIWQVDHALQIVFGELPTNAEPLGRKNTEAYFESDDLDAIWGRLVEESVRVAHPMLEQPWGQRVFRVFDPDGHLVEVGEPMPAVIHRYAQQGMPADAIAARTSMPLEIVQSILGQTL